jgi:hypothetical protein
MRGDKVDKGMIRGSSKKCRFSSKVNLNFSVFVPGTK